MSEPDGLRCIDCGKRMLRTLETRDRPEARRRGLICASCGAKMVSIEKIVGRMSRRGQRTPEATERNTHEAST